MKSLTTTRAIGGSLVVTVPIEIVREEGIKPGQLIEIEISIPNDKPRTKLPIIGPNFDLFKIPPFLTSDYFKISSILSNISVIS